MERGGVYKVSTVISFRVDDRFLDWLKSYQQEGESLNQTAYRLLQTRTLPPPPENARSPMEDWVKDLVRAEMAKLRHEIAIAISQPD